MTSHRLLMLASGVALAASLAACSQSGGGQASSGQPGAAPAGPGSDQAAAPARPAGGSAMQAINDAQFSAGAADAGNTVGSSGNTAGDNATGAGAQTASAQTASAQPDPALVKAEVLLDRANFAPGVIDGRMGENVRNALAAYQKAHNLPTSGALDQQSWNALTSSDKAPVLKTYTVTPQDAAGPFTPNVGEDFVKMSQQQAMGYFSAQQMLAERFHMDQDFLKALNPGADFAKAGTQIAVVDPGQASLAQVASIDVSKAAKSVTALDDSGKVLAVFPATVGSTERPSPKGTWKVKGVAQNPDYTYDPSKLTWGPKKAGKLHIPPGPNSPVGVVWIALTAPDYGIHGTPDPHTIGKTASHGCVRLTNWDAEELSKAVKPGVKVTFVSGRGAADAQG